jgi:hypothetical protein
MNCCLRQGPWDLGVRIARAIPVHATTMTVNRMLFADPDATAFRPRHLSRRKEVIQPHLPVRLPCYDFTLLMRRTFDVAPPCRLD